MLQLKDITKIYQTGDNTVSALKNVNLEFRENEFVAVLGASGSGKTTLLNIIGGLDRYTTGDLMIDKKSTKDFEEQNWDAYRNNAIGFVFQNYNLIPHLTVLGNVEIALTIAGVGKTERKRKAISALKEVGLESQINKKPNQLSGGQMQRVAIARAIVNDPKILLADEPTGALDSATSVQIMELLKEIAKERLIIMVTHNNDLAKEYSTRIVRFKDGEVVGDNNPYTAEDKATAPKLLTTTKSSMSYKTALSLSFKNLLTKKARTLITSIAGSIGIIGVALVLAISSGMSTYMDTVQSSALSSFPITIMPQVKNYEMMMSGGSASNFVDYPTGDIINIYDPTKNQMTHTNIITQEYIDYLEAMDKNLVSAISYQYLTPLNILSKSGDNYTLFDNQTVNLNQLPSNKEMVLNEYEVLSGEYPEEDNEIVLVVDRKNRIDKSFLEKIGITFETETINFDDIKGREFKLIFNDDLYKYNDEASLYLESTDFETMYKAEKNLTLKISAIVRQKEGSVNSLLSKGLAFRETLMDTVLTDAEKSIVSVAQKNSVTKDVRTGKNITLQQYYVLLRDIGADRIPYAVMFFPKTFENKTDILAYLDAYNIGKAEDAKIIYTDNAEMISSMFNEILGPITFVLVAFAAISLVVSSIMIGIITYVSVVERTKEIGVLRSLGARKKDVSRVFNAETILIGFSAGTIGVLIAYLLTIPINLIIESFVGVSNLSFLPIVSAVVLVTISVVLTLISGLIPARIASKKDPVVALRTE